jgi:hypothetical protein
MHAIPFYQKCGYHAEGEPFEEDGGESSAPHINTRWFADIFGWGLAPHQKMVIDITQSSKE